MKRATILATAVSLFGSFGASAEPLRVMEVPPGAMPAFEAVTITRSIGLDPLGGPVWRDGQYVVRATDGDGREMRVILDGRDGHVLAVRPAARRYFAPISPGYGPRDYVVPDDEFGGYERPYERPLPRYDYETLRQSPPRAPVNPNASRPVVRQDSRQAVQQTTKPAARKSGTAAQSAKSVPAVAPAPSPAKSPETSSQSVQSAQPPSPAGSGASPTPKEIRKIDIDRKPASEPATGAATSDEKPATDTPVNPLL